jgi:F-type H+-transporting ATPase subunit delta
MPISEDLRKKRKNNWLSPRSLGADVETGKQIARDAKKLFRLCLVSGRLDEGRARQVVRTILTAGRRGTFEVLHQFERLLRLEQERHSARVQCAVPSTPELESTVRHRIESLYGPGIATAFAHNPNLIGGMRIQVASDVYDGSVFSALMALKKTFQVVTTNGAGRG